MRMRLASDGTSGASNVTNSVLSAKGSYLISAKGMTGRGVEAIDWRQTVVVVLETPALPLAVDNAIRREVACMRSFIFSIQVSSLSSVLSLFRVDLFSHHGLSRTP